MTIQIGQANITQKTLSFGQNNNVRDGVIATSAGATIGAGIGARAGVVKHKNKINLRQHLHFEAHKRMLEDLKLANDKNRFRQGFEFLAENFFKDVKEIKAGKKKLITKATGIGAVIGAAAGFGIFKIATRDKQA